MEGARVRVGDLHFHYVEAGVGPPVVLLHGFPEFWYGWRRQIGPLAAAGYRVIVPDLRGYNLSDRPAGVDEYRLELLVSDVAGLIERLVGAPAVVVGHDWGGIIGWYAAMHRPETVSRLVVVNAPHPAAYARELRRLSSQVLRSWYAGAYQIPLLPEALLRARDFAVLRGIFRSGPADDPEQVEAYVNGFRRPGAIGAALAYYRAAARGPRPRVKRIHAPTLIVWGQRDPFLVDSLTDGLERWVPELTISRLPNVGHWVQHRRPGLVAELIAGFAAG